MDAAPAGGIITLMTDFGWGDPYVGAVKGVIRSIGKSATVEDVAHDVLPHGIIGAALNLYSYYKFWRKGTVHLVIVDPGVGGSRRAIIVRTGSYMFVGPDNGTFTLVYRDEECEVWEITNAKYSLGEGSNTFHGRDIFAPAAAYLAMGVSPSEFGPEVGDPVSMEIPEAVMKDGVITGEVLHVDRFGNLITNVLCDGLGKIRGGRAGEIRVFKEVASYGEAEENEPFFIHGSSGFLEISIKMSRADEALGIKTGDVVYIETGE